MRTERVPRSAAAGAVGIILAVAVAWAQPAFAAAGVAQRGFIASDMFDARRHIDADVSARRLFEIGQVENEAGMTVVARDLDSLAEISRIRIPDAQSGVGGGLSVVDELRHRLYVVYPIGVADDAAVRGVLGGRTSAQVIDEVVRVVFGVAVIDTLRFRLIGAGSLATMQPALQQDRAEGNLIGIKAMSYHRDGGRDLLYFASEVPVGLGNFSVSDHTVFVHQVDVSRLLDPAATSAVDWSHPVPQCSLILARDGAGVVFRSALTSTISVACRQGGGQGISGQPLETPGVVRVTMQPGVTSADTSRFVNDFFPVSGNLIWGVAAVDPVAERLLVQIEGSTTEAGVWIFDIPSASWVGLVSLPSGYANGKTTALGIDVAYGRFHATSATDAENEMTVVSASMRGVQTDQGRIERFQPSTDVRKGRPVVDPVRHRTFLFAVDGYLVLEDNVPARISADAGDPDENTVNVTEGAGTGVNFIGGAQAYGARIRWVGGTRGLERNANPYLENPPSELSPNTGGILPGPPSEGTRDLHLARIVHTTLSNGEASARATGGERDLENTDADLGNWTNYLRRWGGPDLSAERWPYPVVDCADFGGRDDKRDQSDYGASVTCQRDATQVSAVAVDESFQRGEVVRYAQARARSTVVRDPARGVVVVAEAEATGIEFFGPLPGTPEQLVALAGIGRVATRAETWATGRPAATNGIGAGSRFSRVLEGAWVLRDGERVSLCGTGAQTGGTQICDARTVAASLNRALGFRIRVDAPEPEPARAAGSPGGFEALIVRDPLERANEAAINEEADARRLEVPGLVVTAFNDGRIPSRIVVSLAGVSAESHYGIYLLTQAVPFVPRPGTPGGPIGGVVPLPTPGGNGPPTPSPRDDGPSSLPEQIVDGLKVILASPVAAARAAGLWAFFGGPLILMIRRRDAIGEA